MQEFPKWIYSADGAKIIQSQDEHPGEGWFDSPADIAEEKEPEKRKTRQKKTEAE